MKRLLFIFASLILIPFIAIMLLIPILNVFVLRDLLEAVDIEEVDDGKLH